MRARATSGSDTGRRVGDDRDPQVSPSGDSRPRPRGVPRGVLRISPRPFRRTTAHRGIASCAKCRTENRARRYSIDPLELLHADDDARKKSLELIGVYHSHPDHPAAPSEYDRSRAASWLSYVIVSVVDREPKDVTAWQFDETARLFRPEAIVVR